MYICICNGITDREVRAAAESGAKNWKEVHSYCGFKPNCGKCEEEIYEFLGKKSCKTNNQSSLN